MTINATAQKAANIRADVRKMMDSPEYTEDYMNELVFSRREVYHLVRVYESDIVRLLSITEKELEKVAGIDPQ